jgi:hypothetical protein
MQPEFGHTRSNDGLSKTIVFCRVSLMGIHGTRCLENISAGGP